MARWARVRFVLLWVYCFSLFLCEGIVVGFSDAGLSGVGLSGCRVSDYRVAWKWVSESFGKVLDQAGHKSPRQAPQSPRLRLRRYIRGELNTSMELDALREKGMDVSVGGCLKRNIASRRERRERK